MLGMVRLLTCLRVLVVFLFPCVFQWAMKYFVHFHIQKCYGWLALTAILLPEMSAGAGNGAGSMELYYMEKNTEGDI